MREEYDIGRHNPRRNPYAEKLKEANASRAPQDFFNLQRFLDAQEGTYDRALSEIHSGHKRTHWIWYVFPQLVGLGYSERAQYYGICGLGEAKAYLENTVLHDRLLEICKELLALPSNDAEEVMGFPDDLKLRSSMTLFSEADPEEPVFKKVLAKFFDGEKDEATLEILRVDRK